MRSRTRSAGLALGLVCTLGTSAPAPAATVPSLDGPNVVHYGAPAFPMTDVARLVRQGRRLADGGCEFSVERRVSPGEVVTEVELAYDRDTCRSLVQVGRPVGDTPADADTSPAVSGRARVAGPNAGGDGSAMTHVGHYAYQWSWFDEPARWVRGCDVEDSCGPLAPVNTVRNSVEWRPDGACAVAPGTIGWVDYRITWLTLTGWTVQRNDWNHSPDPIPCGADIFSENYNHFQNKPFCAVLGGLIGLIFETNTYYEPNYVRGDRNGGAWVRYAWRKNGLCNDLLRFNQKSLHQTF